VAQNMHMKTITVIIFVFSLMDSNIIK